MWPELDDTPPRDADTVLPEVLRRGRELRRVQTRRRQATLLGRAAAAVVVVGLLGAVTRGVDEPGGRTQVAAPSTTADGEGPGPSSSTFPPLSVGEGGNPGTALPPGTSSTVGAARGRTAPVVVLEVRAGDGRYHTAVLEPGSLEPFAITAASAERQTPVISPDGRTIAFQRLQPHHLTGQRRWELFVVDPDGTNLRQITGNLLGTGPALLDPPLGPGSRWPTWSPDGSRLAFSCSGPTGLPQICVAGADGTGRHPISLEGQGFFQPSWSPDGRTIAAKRELSSGMVDLWLLDPSGQGLPVALPTPAFQDGVTLSWLGSGTLVYLRLGDAAGALRTLDVATGVERTIPTSGPVRFPIACGRDQVLYLQSAAAPDSRELRTGGLVLTGTDGSAPTTVLPAADDEERLPSSCATR